MPGSARTAATTAPNAANSAPAGERGPRAASQRMLGVELAPVVQQRRYALAVLQTGPAGDAAGGKALGQGLLVCRQHMDGVVRAVGKDRHGAGAMRQAP